MLVNFKNPSKSENKLGLKRLKLQVKIDIINYKGGKYTKKYKQEKHVIFALQFSFEFLLLN